MKQAVAIVTGASQGIGRATAIRLARDFSSLTLVARNTNRLLETASEVRAQGAEAFVVSVVLSDPQAPVTVVDDTIKRFGRIDALLNIAGAVPQVDLFDMSDEAWESGMALKLHGARRLALRAWDTLKASKGSVVFISGDSAQIPKAAYAAVGTINAAIVALAKAFADRGMTDGVQVNSVLPGPIMTDRRKSYLANWAPVHNVSLEEASKEFLARTGVGRYGTPEEIAELMAFLVSPKAHWMTGSAIRMDGGEVTAV